MGATVQFNGSITPNTGTQITDDYQDNSNGYEIVTIHLNLSMHNGSVHPRATCGA